MGLALVHFQKYWLLKKDILLIICLPFRDYIHVMDLADSHVAAIKKIFDPNLVGVKIYNLGTGSGTSVLEMIKAFEEASGRKGTNKMPTFVHFCPLSICNF